MARRRMPGPKGEENADSTKRSRSSGHHRGYASSEGPFAPLAGPSHTKPHSTGPKRRRQRDLTQPQSPGSDPFFGQSLRHSQWMPAENICPTPSLQIFRFSRPTRRSTLKARQPIPDDLSHLAHMETQASLLWGNPRWDGLQG